ncbi:MAG: hypothetical protein Q8N28_02195 [bacterium]|nr:hypothetical protein [bacterium]
MNLKIFNSYDIRGKYPEEINEKVVAEIVGALKKYYLSKVNSQRSTVKAIVGRDARLSSPKLYRAAIKQLTTDNLQLITIPVGLATTPMLYFLVNHFNADLGIIITASHNPKEYNGLKIVGKKAMPMSGKEILKWTI